MFKKFTCALAAAMLPALAFAGDKLIDIENPWVRATVGNSTTTAGYVKLVNKTGEDDALYAVETPVARMSMLHKTTMNDEGIMSMDHVGEIVLKKDTFVLLEPGDLHMMIMGLEQKLVPGYEIPMTFKFKNSPDQTVRVNIHPIKTTWKDIENGKVK